MDKNEIKQIFHDYDITSWGFKDLDLQSLRVLENRDIHKLTSATGIAIINHSITKNNCTLKIRECFISRNKVNMRIKDGFFIRTLFSDVTFNNGSFQNYLFINCYFKDTVIATSSFNRCIFINCEFSNTHTMDSEFINCEFINTNVKDVLNEFDISIKEQFYITEENISYSELFGSLDMAEERVQAKEKNLLLKEEGETNMNEDIIITDKTITALELGKHYENCIFQNFDVVSIDIKDDTEFYLCQFKNIKFISVNFINVVFDDSMFENCTFSNCTFSRCSLINAKLDESNKFKCHFFKVNFFNARVECIMDNSSFDGCSIENLPKSNTITNEKITENYYSIEEICSKLEEIKVILHHEKFIESIDKPAPEITDEDIYQYFNKLNLMQAMSMISSITQKISQNNSTSNSSAQSNTTNII